MENKEKIEQLKEDDVRYTFHHVTQMREVAEAGSRIIVSGKGCLVWDIEGREYIDGLAGIYTTQVGLGRKEIYDAMYAQAEKLAFYPPFQYYATVPFIELSKKLSEIAPGSLSRVFLTNGGSESNETALKMIRQYHYNKGFPSKYKFIARRGSFHGDTFGALSAHGLTAYRQKFGPLVPGFRHVAPPYCYRCSFGQTYGRCDFECVKAVEEMIIFEGPETMAGFIGEPIQNALGDVVPPKEYWPRIREICDKYGLLLIMDEVCTGFGRTGKWFGCEHWDIVPDILVVAKGMSSGYQPIGAAIVTKEVGDAFYGEADKAFMGGYTFGGHPITCAAALANIEIMEKESLVARAKEMGDYLFGELEGFKEHKVVGDIRGLGLQIGIELVKDKASKEKFPPEERVGIRIRDRAFELGLMIRERYDTLGLAPPLILTKEEADRILEILDRAISDIEAEL